MHLALLSLLQWQSICKWTIGVVSSILLAAPLGCKSSYLIPEGSYSINERNYTFAIYNTEHRLMTHPLKDLAHEVSRRKDGGKAPITDIYIISHGWNYSGTEAVANYHNLLEMVDCSMRLPVGQEVDGESAAETCVPSMGVLKKAFPSFQPYFIFIAWTSTTRPLTDSLQALLPFGFDKVLRFPTYLIDTIPVHMLTAWKQSLNASQTALGGSPPSTYFYNEFKPEQYGVESLYFKDADLGNDEPVSSLIYKLMRAKGLKGSNPCKEDWNPPLDISGVKLHLLGHSYGAKLVAIASMEALRRFIFEDKFHTPPSGYTDWEKECLVKMHPELLAHHDEQDGTLEKKMRDISFNAEYVYDSTYGTRLPFFPPDESAAREVVESAYKGVSFKSGSEDSLIESLVLINPAMHSDELQYGNGYLRVIPLSPLWMIPRKAIVYSRYDYANGALFATKELVLSSKSTESFNINPRYDVPVFSQSLGLVASTLSLAYSVAHGVGNNTVSALVNIPADFWHHINNNRFFDQKRPTDTHGVTAGMLRIGNAFDFVLPVYPFFLNRDEDHQGIFRISRPGLGKTGLRRAAIGRLKGFNLGGLAEFYEESVDISEQAFCRFSYKILPDDSSVDIESTRKRFYSFNAGAVYNSVAVPFVGSHGDLRSNDVVACEDAQRGGSGCLDSLCQFISGAWRMMPTRRHAVQAGDHYTCPPACVPPTRDVAGPDCKRSGTASPPAWPRGWSHRRGDRPLHI